QRRRTDRRAAAQPHRQKHEARTARRLRGADLNLHHLLIDAAEDRVFLSVEHLDLDAIAMLEERRRWFAGLDRLDHPLLGNAGITQAALVDRLAWPAIGAAVGDRARADDRAGAKLARLRRVRDALSE